MRVELTYDLGIDVFDTRLNGDADTVRSTLTMRKKLGRDGSIEAYGLSVRSRMRISEYEATGNLSGVTKTEDSGWSAIAMVDAADIEAAGLESPVTFVDLLDLMGSVGVRVETGGKPWRLLRCDVDGGNIWTASQNELVEE